MEKYILLSYSKTWFELPPNLILPFPLHFSYFPKLLIIFVSRGKKGYFKIATKYNIVIYNKIKINHHYKVGQGNPAERKSPMIRNNSQRPTDTQFKNHIKTLNWILCYRQRTQIRISYSLVCCFHLWEFRWALSVDSEILSFLVLSITPTLNFFPSFHLWVSLSSEEFDGHIQFGVVCFKDTLSM